MVTTAYSSSPSILSKESQLFLSHVTYIIMSANEEYQISDSELDSLIEAASAELCELLSLRAHKKPGRTPIRQIQLENSVKQKVKLLRKITVGGESGCDVLSHELSAFLGTPLANALHH